ncbi:hypothetical protein EVAR_70977_1 [Eumeta japonica]|uniref:Uncharacterized protein n=1 Tax=Eumeta variegata TaxID=151549 RepID=A0A4C2A994_EUMVA|nr:hypothetical protein EVAR_70977_1 [Eumeta japonica]
MPTFGFHDTQPRVIRNQRWDNKPASTLWWEAVPHWVTNEQLIPRRHHINQIVCLPFGRDGRQHQQCTQTPEQLERYNYVLRGNLQ